MTTPASRQSAIVYDFAARARAILESRGQYGRAIGHAARALPVVEFGSGWYHEAAIREEERTRKP